MDTSPQHHRLNIRSPTRSRIGITIHGGEVAKRRAQVVAHELSLPVVTSEEDDFDFHLMATDEHLELRDCRQTRTKPVRVDFIAPTRRSHVRNLSRRQPLARAFGKKVGFIVDATAGYGQDAVRLALMGFRVTAIERAPVLAVLVRDALQRFERDTGLNLSGRLDFIAGDSHVVLADIAPRPDAIYLDPMFPPKRRTSAAVRKEMQLLRALVGDDPDGPALLELSRNIARDRVVVKRPDDAPVLAPKPNLTFEGKLVRYDVYLSTPASRA